MGRAVAPAREDQVLKVYYVGDDLPVLDDQEFHLDNSIFLAGPTPRSKDVETWRKEALKILEDLDFAGSVFVPETAIWQWLGDYDGQVTWEWHALGLASCTLFWVPRDLKDMPAFTTNVEFGFMAAFAPERVVLGYPPGAKKVRYLASIADNIDRFFVHLGQHDGYGMTPVPRATSLRESLMLAVAKAHGT
jgi:hypothetical protein